VVSSEQGKSVFKGNTFHYLRERQAIDLVELEILQKLEVHVNEAIQSSFVALFQPKPTLLP